MAIDGSVFYNDGVTLVSDGLDVKVTNITQDLSQPSTTGDAGAGRYSVTFIDILGGIVAAVGDEIEIIVTDVDGNEHSLTYILTAEDITASSATVDVTTDVPVPPEPVTKLVVSGTVYYKDGKTPAAGLVVKVLESSSTTDVEGKYSVTVADGTVATSGSEITITVEKEAEEVGSATQTLGKPEADGSLTIEAPDVIISLEAPPEETSLLAIEGTVFLKDGIELAPNGLTVDVTNKTQDLSQSSATGDAGAGRYSVTFLDILGGVVAVTGDEIEIAVTDADGNERGRVAYQLTTADVLGNQVTIDIVLDVTATLTVSGAVYAVDGETPVPAGLTVTVANASRALEVSGTTADEGKYSITLETTEPGAVVAAADEEISVTVVDEEGNVIGSETHALTTAEVVGKGTVIDIVTTYLPFVTFTRVLAPGLNMISVPLANSEATMDGGEPVAIEKISDLKTLLGADTPVYYYNTGEGKYEEAPVEMGITGDLGLVVMLLDETTITFEGEGWPGEINLVPGLNMFAVPLNANQTVGDLKALLGEDAPIHYYDISEGMFKEAEDTMAIEGGVGYVTMMLESISLSIDGSPWENEVLASPFIGGQLHFDPTSTPLMAVKGTVINESTGAALNGLSVTVRHLSSDTVITDTTDSNGAFSTVFLNVFNNQLFRAGDVFKIDIRSNNGNIYIEPIQYTVTQEDIKLGRVILGNLAARTIPKNSKLMQNWPNPFNPETWIPFQLSKAANVAVTIYDMHGRVVRRFDLGYTAAGIYNTKLNAIYWDGTNDVGERVSSGIYFYHIQAGEFSASRKMVILK